MTGATRGLGRAMVNGLAQAGADVIVSSRKQDACDAVAAELARDFGIGTLACAAHAGELAALDELIERSLAHFGKIDILINNAGINPTAANGPAATLPPEMFQKLFQVNLMGPWYLASRLGQKMTETGGGSIINVISVGGIKNSATQSFYASTKAGLKACTRVLAAELADGGVRVNALAPRSYHSDLFEAASKNIPGFYEGAAGAALQKRVAAVDEIIGPVLYLASDMSMFTTGTTLISDGGYLAM